MQQASSSSQAIPLPPAQQLHQQQRHAADVAMASPGAGAGFNPASYTRAMFGSPVSWRGGSSFGARLYPGTSPSQLFGSFDPNSGKLSSSIESDRGAFMQTQDEFCRNYTCCGLNLSDLHALVEHFEEAHVVVIDPSAPHQPSLLPNQLPHMAAHYPQHAQQQHLPYPAPGPAPQAQSFDPSDDMELDDQSPPSSSASSPPRTPPYVPAIATQVPYVPAPYSTLSSQPPSACPSPVSAFDTTAVLPSRAGAQQAYANYPPYPAMAHDQHHHEDVAVAPAMLFGRHNAQQIKQEPGTSKAAAQAAPATPTQQTPSPTGSAPPTPGGASETSRASSTLSRPASSLLLSKPFRCPKPNCNKSYKQANGLKYHMTHGSCSFAPPKDLEAVQALLAEKGLSAEGDLSESDAREVEREAERRLRPFACAVGECTRRYKNMNGLRYHYQHSGEHGAEGLRLLASGQHECLQHHTGRARKAAQAQAAAAMAAVTERGTGTLHPVSQPSTPIVQQQPQQQQQQQQQQQAWYGQQYAWQQPGSVHA